MLDRFSISGAYVRYAVLAPYAELIFIYRFGGMARIEEAGNELAANRPKIISGSLAATK